MVPRFPLTGNANDTDVLAERLSMRTFLLLHSLLHGTGNRQIGVAPLLGVVDWAAPVLVLCVEHVGLPAAASEKLLHNFNGAAPGSPVEHGAPLFVGGTTQLVIKTLLPCRSQKYAQLNHARKGQATPSLRCRQCAFPRAAWHRRA